MSPAPGVPLAYLRRLQAAFRPGEARAVPPQVIPAAEVAAPELAEPLTERELTVLRYLQGDLSNEEIASVLYISVNTIKTHVKNIYRKLNAMRRREAVQRARELRLL